MVTSRKYYMFIEIIVDGDDIPKVFPIEKAGKMAQKLEEKGVKFRLGKTSQ